MKPILQAALVILALSVTAGAQESKPFELPQKCTQAIEATMPGMAAMGNMDMPMMEQMQKMHGMEASGIEQMKAMHATMMPMMQAMMIKDRDLAFACAMIPHHQSAIDMAKAQLASGKDEELKQLAQKMIDAQTAEIEELKAEIEKAGQ